MYNTRLAACIWVHFYVFIDLKEKRSACSSNGNLFQHYITAENDRPHPAGRSRRFAFPSPLSKLLFVVVMACCLPWMLWMCEAPLKMHALDIGSQRMRGFIFLIHLRVNFSVQIEGRHPGMFKIYILHNFVLPFGSQLLLKTIHALKRRHPDSFCQ